MLPQLLLGSGRVWLALFTIYVFAIVYGIVSLTGDTTEHTKSYFSETLPKLNDIPAYDDELERISSYDIIMNGSDDALRNLPIDFPLSRGLALPTPGIRIGGVRRNATIAIGIPSIHREGHDYLFDTINSLLKDLSPEQRLNTVFVIYIGETDYGYLDKRVLEIKEKFSNEIDERTIEIISPSKTLYPDWSKTVRSSFGDTFERTKWRSKQNLDQIFLMMHIYHLRAKYYLMMEDDVIASGDYMTKLLKAVRMKEKQPWIYMSFCGLGAIGKLFRRRTLPAYASFLHTFWNAKPLDWLQTDFARARACSYDEQEKICFKRLKTVLPETHPSLFQHVGKFSSLPGKIQKLRDGKFRN